MQRYASIVVFFATVAVVLLFWAVVPGGWTAAGATDYQRYYLPVAQNLSAGRGLVALDGEPAIRYPPGFPLLLTGLLQTARWTGTSVELWIQGFTLLAMGGAAVVLYFLARMIVGTWGALGTVVLWMTYPFNLWLTRQPSSEILFFPLFYAALLFVGKILWGDWRRDWTAVGAGVLMGCAILVRPIALLGGGLLAVIPFVLCWRKGIRQWAATAVLILVGNGLVILPWEIWVWRKTGQWILVSSVGSEAMLDGLTCALVTRGYRNRLEVSPRIAELMEAAAQRWQQGELGTSGEIVWFLAEQCEQRPFSVLRLLGWKMARAWYGTDAQHKGEQWILAIQVGYLFLIAWGGYHLWYSGHVGREWIFFSSMVVLYFWAMTTISLSILRYMVPVTGLLFVLAGFNLELLLKRRQ
ncbi:MAG: hypothetical protein HOP18_17245 [Deltaproteobacteria bacterium]|nr:hypothetical protein [Deltaproteobacteria bacterium]